MNNLLNKLLLLGLLTLTIGLANALTPEQQQAKQQGELRYQQGFCEESLLKVAAEAGDKDSQYYLGDCKLQDYSMMTKEAAYWFEQAANQGDTYAMMRLAETDDLCKLLKACGNQNTNEWRTKVQKILAEQASQGNAEAMYQLYLMTKSYSWLEKSAEAGYPVAQYKLALRYREGGGLFILSSRQEAVDKWMKAAADQNYPPAMALWAYRLIDLGNVKEGREYLISAANKGYTAAILSYATGLAYSHIYPNKKNEFEIKENFVQGYGLLNLLANIEDRFGKMAIEQMEVKPTDQQVIEGKAYVEEWQKNHPPLSEFRHKYWYPAN